MQIVHNLLTLVKICSIIKSNNRKGVKIMFKFSGEKIKVCAMVLFIVMAISAVIGGIVIWVTYAEFELEGGFWVGLGEIVGGIGAAYLLCLLIHGFGVIVADHEGTQQREVVVPEKKPMEYNNSVFQNMDKNHAEQKAPKSVPAAGEWKCPKCGKINQNYVGTCGCGEIKPK